MDFENKTFTLTFGDVGESHVGMQKIGHLANKGYDLKDLERINKYFDDFSCQTKIFNLHINKNTPHAYLLVIYGGVNCLLQNCKQDSNSLFEEHNKLDPDKKALMYSRVVNKIARHNLCFDNVAQKSDYKNGKSTIIAYKDVPITNFIRKKLMEVIDLNQEFICEANYYYDSKKCGIGYHGDTERRKVIGIRLGCSTPIAYQWYHKGTPYGKRKKIILHHGDLYVMSEKASGFDWKSKSIYTLRHVAGSKKYIQVK